MIFPKVQVNNKKCRAKVGSPIACRKCLEACEPIVLLASPELLTRGKDNPPKGWKIWPVMSVRCLSGCRACVEACPANAISKR